MDGMQGTLPRYRLAVSTGPCVGTDSTQKHACPDICSSVCLFPWLLMRMVGAHKLQIFPACSWLIATLWLTVALQVA
jgi:hypothetical protein